MPVQVRARVEHEVGPIMSVTAQGSGFTPSVTVCARLVGGGRVFVKAADGGAFPVAAGMHRSEAELLAGLGEVPEIPRLVGSFEQEGWVVLVVEGVDGRHPHLPWNEGELGHVLEGLERLSRRLTPSPIAAPTIGDRFGPELNGWRELRKDSSAAAGLGLAWATANVDRLAGIEQEWPEAAAGEALLHADLRADQILLSQEGLRVVDWPHACIGAAWIDPLLFFPSVRLQGGPDIDDLVRRCVLTAEAPRDRLTTMAVAVAGYFLHRATLPDPPGLPTVRRFQRAQGEVLAGWLEAVLHHP